jgi:hypothetical protein
MPAIRPVWTLAVLLVAALLVLVAPVGHFAAGPSAAPRAAAAPAAAASPSPGDLTWGG